MRRERFPGLVMVRAADGQQFVSFRAEHIPSSHWKVKGNFFCTEGLTFQRMEGVPYRMSRDLPGRQVLQHDRHMKGRCLMCEFCGCGEPFYRSVAVLVPTVNKAESGAAAALVSSVREEEDEPGEGGIIDDPA
jgi:hypothetical protein